MKKLSSQTIRWISLGAILLTVAALLFARQQTRRKNQPPQSGRFEDYYTSTIDALHVHSQKVRDKLRANMPGDLEILPEELLRRPKTTDPENPGVATINDITLRGIYWSDTMPLAEINDRLCKPGDQIAGFTLQEIQPYQILLLDATGSTQTVSLIRDL
ncbi:MAG: hypothetical protein JEZ10_05170 [Verrucomicrobia bacterium]|nr:hypothetical protein [Verrucomicrobiota bacterium]